MASALLKFGNLRVLRASGAFPLNPGQGSIAMLVSILKPIGPRLEELRLSYCNLTDEDLKQLLEEVPLPRLQHLWLRNNWDLTDASAELLQATFATLATEIKVISLRNCGIKPKAVALLRKCFTNAEIDMGVQARAEALTVQAMLLKRLH